MAAAPASSPPLLPRVDIVEGSKAILMIDTGLGPGNGAAVCNLARPIARGRHIILTTKSLRPEHALGASAWTR